MDKRIIEELYAPFDVKTKPGSGNYKYIKSSDAVDRMNKTFGGDWSTEVIKDEIVEDNIIVRMIVTVYPEVGERTFPSGFSHEGYGSSPIKRYNSGPNKGKIINIGSDYKAASSMAIRNACSRWGVGLFLDEEPLSPPRTKEAAKQGMPSIPVPAQAETPKVKIPAPLPPVAKKPVPNVPTTPVAPKAVEKKETKAPGLPSLPTPPQPAAVVDKELSPKAAAPFPKIPMPKNDDRLPEEESDNISEVQKAALNGLLTIRGLEYNKLVTDAFNDKKMEVSNPLPIPDDLTYKQAVVVIKYGNDLFKNKK